MNPRCHYALSGRDWPCNREYLKRLLAFAAGAVFMAALMLLASCAK